jgi:hypothetical protein
VEHHAIPAPTRLVAQVSPSLSGDVDLLAPAMLIEGIVYRARILDMAAIPVGLPGEIVMSADLDRDAILGAVDIILYGCPVGRPS